MAMDDLPARREQVNARKTWLADPLRQAEDTLCDEDVRRSLQAQLPDLVRQVKNSLANADFGTQ